MGPQAREDAVPRVPPATPDRTVQCLVPPTRARAAGARPWGFVFRCLAGLSGPLAAHPAACRTGVAGGGGVSALKPAEAPFPARPASFLPAAAA